MFSGIASLKDARDYIVGLADIINEQLDEPAKASTLKLMKGLEQFFDIVETIDIQAGEGYVISPSESTDIGNHGLDLVSQLIRLMDHLELSQRRKDLEQISLVMARWIVCYHGQVKQLEPIVNACAWMANMLLDKTALIVLYDLMTDIIESCSSNVRLDMDTINDMRPWRLLHINRSIVATRSHDPDIMKTAFDELLIFLPNEANGFFEQRMKEMVELYYPPHVRQIMEFYYQHKLAIGVH